MLKNFPLWIIASVVAACGGGGSSNTVDTRAGSDAGNAAATGAAGGTGSPAGLFRGSTSTGRALAGIVLESGEYWLLYSPIGNASLIAGAEQGHANFAGGSFTSTDLKDFNLEGLGISSGTVSGSYASTSNISGTAVFRNSQVSFSATYDPVSAAPSDLAAAAGNYTGSAAVVGGSEAASLKLEPSGSLSGVSQRGCRFSGTVTAHPTGNVYALSVTFAGGVCSNGTGTVTGVAYYDATSRRVYAAALNPGRTNGFIFAGGK